MCEAISSGLVAISSDISAIPEFVDDGKNRAVGATGGLCMSG